MSEDFFDMDEGWYVCPECKSVEVLEYSERIFVYDRNGNHVDTKDWGCSFHGLRCEDCGWENF